MGLALAELFLTLASFSSGNEQFCLPRWPGDCRGNRATMTDRTSSDGSPSNVTAGLGRWPFPVFADWDGDLDEDLIVADMGGLHYFERVGADLQERTGADNPFGWIDVGFVDGFSEVVAIAIADWDDDGDQDLLIGGRLMKDFRFFERVPSGGLVELTGDQRPFHQYYDERCSRAVPTFADWDGDGDLDLIVGSGGGRLFYFERLAVDVLQLREGEFEDPLMVPDTLMYMHTAPYIADFDSDGDLDLVVSYRNIFFSFPDPLQASTRYFERVDSATIVERTGATRDPLHGITSVEIMHCAFVDWNQDGLQDFVFGGEAGQLAYYEASRVATWEVDDENNPFAGVVAWAYPVGTLVDWDEDGDLDLCVYTSKDQVYPWYYERLPSGSYSTNGHGFYPLYMVNSLAPPTFADWDGDGNLDIIAFEGKDDPRLRVYGKPPSADGYGSYLEDPFNLGLLKTHYSDSLGEYYYPPVRAGPVVVDWDGDGDLDLAVAILSIGSPEMVRFRYFERSDRGAMVERTGDDNPFASVEIHMAYDWEWTVDNVFVSPVFVDLNMDGDLDLVVSTNHAGLYFERGPDGSVTESPTPFDTIAGDSYTFVDWDNDSDPDLVIGGSSGAFSFSPHGDCTQPTLCGGNGVCKGIRGECACNYGYSGASCSACSASYYTDSQAGWTPGETQASTCEPCPGLSALTSVCTSRGVCADDAAARAVPAASTLQMLAIGTGECNCSSGAFYGDACELGVCPAGTYETVVASSYVCATCPAGRYSLEGHPCQDCYRGMVAAEGSGSCDRCPPGEHPAEGQVVCTLCDPGHYPIENSNDCGVCPQGQYSAAGICKVCDAGQVPMAHQGACTPCEAGRYAPNASGTCELCATDTYSLDGASACVACSAGQEPTPGQDACEPCLAGMFSPSGGACQFCDWGTYSSEGADFCEGCALGYYGELGQTECPLDWQYWVVYFFLLAVATGAWFPVAFALRRRIRVSDIWETHDGHNGTVVTALQAHSVRPGSRVQGKILGSGAYYFDQCEEWLTFEPLDAERLRYHCSKDTKAQASGGALMFKFPQELHKTRGAFIRVVSPASNFVLMYFVLAAGQTIARVKLLDDRNRPEGLELLLTTVHPGGLILAALAAIIVRWHHANVPSPLSRRIEQYRRQLSKTNPNPKETPRGALRGIPAGNLRALFAMFEDFISSERDAYYLNFSITRPTTEPFHLSMAEMMGPTHTDFFVSHFWGTPFKHFVRAVTNHAQQAGGGDSDGLAYWICFLSNNQWKVKDELGAGDWRSSSFYLALQDSGCKATCMVLDNQALPLTRSWCLFEVLQTYKLTHTRGETFGGLTFCTPEGTIGIDRCFDTTLALAKRLSTLRMRDARATNKDDEAMILALVEDEEASTGSTMDAFISTNMNATLVKAKDLFEAETSVLESILSFRAVDTSSDAGQGSRDQGSEALSQPEGSGDAGGGSGEEGSGAHVVDVAPIPVLEA